MASERKTDLAISFNQQRNQNVERRWIFLTD